MDCKIGYVIFLEAKGLMITFSIVNPLLAMDDATIKRQVMYFYDKNNLKEVVDFETLQRGALLAKSRQASSEFAQETTQLDLEDAGELRSMTKALRVLLFTCAIGAIVQ
jgi:hypothetical protein